MKTQQSVETQKKRRLLLFLPLFILPFITMAFWALGGGKTSNSSDSFKQRGFNTALPSAKFDDKQKVDKMSIYESISKKLDGNNALGNDFESLGLSNNSDTQTPEKQIDQKLAQLNLALNQKSIPETHNYSNVSKSQPSIAINNDVNRLEKLMQSMDGSKDDPEMKQLNAILEKIMDIQHPGRTKERIENQKENASGALKVHVLKEGDQSIIALANKFNDAIYQENSNTISAAVHQEQEAVSGSVIKLRLLDSIVIKGIVIPKNQFVYGIANIKNERLQIDLKTLRYKNNILPVFLSAYDLDGIEGLYIPGAISRDASKKGVEDAIQSLQIMTMDPSLPAQAASVGVQAVKGLFSKKVKQVRVKLKAGYQLLLKDNNQRN